MRENLGTQPASPSMKLILSLLVPTRESQEEVIVHHYTDRPKTESNRFTLQLEIERRSKVLGFKFERIFV